MPADRLNRMKQRLQKGADAFEFTALIEGVSTLDDESQVAKSPAQSPKPEASPKKAALGFSPLAEIAADKGPLALEDDFHLRPGTSPRRTPPPRPVQEGSSTRPVGPSRMRGALENLSARLLQEMGAMRKALEAGDPEVAGYALAQTNEVLELLYTLDPNGDIARQHQLPSAPPIGKTWPLSCWSMVELAESPLSALLPPNADLELVREMLYSAWGVHEPPKK